MLQSPQLGLKMASLYPFHRQKLTGRLAMKKNTKSSTRTPAPLNLLDPKCAGIDVGASERAKELGYTLVKAI